MKAIIYCRVSTGKQGDSIDLQLVKCASFCKMSGYQIIDTIVDEDVSGSVPIFSRPEGAKIKAHLDSATHIVTWKMDRMFRDTLDCLSVTAELQKRNVNLCIVNMGGQPVDTSSPMGKVMLTLTSAFAELERNQIAERITSSLRHKKEKREVFNGSLPFGFSREGKKMIPNDDYETARNVIRIKTTNDSISFQELADKVGVSKSQAYRIYKNKELYEL